MTNYVIQHKHPQGLRLSNDLKILKRGHRDIRYTNNSSELIQPPNITNLSFVSQRIATTHTSTVIKDVDQINRFDFMGLNPTGCQIAILLA